MVVPDFLVPKPPADEPSDRTPERAGQAPDHGRRRPTAAGRHPGPALPDKRRTAGRADARGVCPARHGGEHGREHRRRLHPGRPDHLGRHAALAAPAQRGRRRPPGPDGGRAAGGLAGAVRADLDRPGVAESRLLRAHRQAQGMGGPGLRLLRHPPHAADGPAAQAVRHPAHHPGQLAGGAHRGLERHARRRHAGAVPAAAPRRVDRRADAAAVAVARRAGDRPVLHERCGIGRHAGTRDRLLDSARVAAGAGCMGLPAQPAASARRGRHGPRHRPRHLRLLADPGAGNRPGAFDHLVHGLEPADARGRVVHDLGGVGADLQRAAGAELLPRRPAVLPPPESASA